MKLDELELMRFLPAWMQNDETATAFAYAVENQMRRVITQIVTLQIYSAIDRQSDTILDELAWQFNVIEYSSALPIGTKRKLIQSAIQTHRQRGTVAAVEWVVGNIFGDGWVEEWPAYAGEPYHFKAHTSNVSAGDTEAAAFTAAVTTSQNLRSVLDAIIIETVLQQERVFGGYLHEAETIYI